MMGAWQCLLRRCMLCVKTVPPCWCMAGLCHTHAPQSTSGHSSALGLQHCSQRTHPALQFRDMARPVPQGPAGPCAAHVCLVGGPGDRPPNAPRLLRTRGGFPLGVTGSCYLQDGASETGSGGRKPRVGFGAGGQIVLDRARSMGLRPSGQANDIRGQVLGYAIVGPTICASSVQDPHPTLPWQYTRCRTPGAVLQHGGGIQL
jgi:hypothetical protein